MFRVNVASVGVSLLLVVLLAAAIPSVALAQGAEGGMDEIPSFYEVLVRLAGGGGLGIVLAFLAENAGWFQNLTKEQKKWVILGVCVGLPVLATVLLQYVPENVWAVIDPYWKAIAIGFLAWGGSQVAYLWQKARKAEIQSYKR